MELKRAIKPITYLKNHTAELVRQVEEDGRPYVITKNGEAKVVIMDVGQYDRWRKALALLKMVAQSEADVAAGRVMSNQEAFRRAEKAMRRELKGK